VISRAHVGVPRQSHSRKARTALYRPGIHTPLLAGKAIGARRLSAPGIHYFAAQLPCCYKQVIRCISTRLCHKRLLRPPQAQPDADAAPSSPLPATAASMAAMSIFFMVCIAFIARAAAAPSGCFSACVSARGTICQDTPHLSRHQLHSDSAPPLPTMADQYLRREQRAGGQPVRRASV
jgi:hypothetical protein